MAAETYATLPACWLFSAIRIATPPRREEMATKTRLVRLKAAAPHCRTDVTSLRCLRWPVYYVTKYAGVNTGGWLRFIDETGCRCHAVESVGSAAVRYAPRAESCEEWHMVGLGNVTQCLSPEL